MIRTDRLYPLEVVRALALHAQGLTAPIGAGPEPSLAVIEGSLLQLGAVQLDSIHVVRRSQYLTLWSRLGCYDPLDLDRLVYSQAQPSNPSGPIRPRFFEGWLHALCILPFSEYRYRLPHMRRIREATTGVTYEWLSLPGSAQFMQAILERIRREGPLRASDFTSEGSPRGDRPRIGWWHWRPVKIALEHLAFANGDLMVAGRDSQFQPIFDLRERVLPGLVDITEPAWDEMAHHVLESAVKSSGICTPSQAAGAIHEIKPTRARPVIEQLLTERIFGSVRAVLCDGKTHTLLVHRDNLPLLERAAGGGLPTGRTTFLGPFDNLFWPRGRDSLFWSFQNILEAYKPEHKRKWGYYSLAILHKDRLVGRFDPRLERPTNLLRLKSLILEPGIEPEEEFIIDLARAMRDFMVFHAARDLTIERSDPVDLGKKLLAAY